MNMLLKSDKIVIFYIEKVTKLSLLCYFDKWIGENMKRLLMDRLIKWKDTKDRKPLLLKGVRQVGKTHLLKEFGRNQFRECHYPVLRRNDSVNSAKPRHPAWLFHDATGIRAASGESRGAL